MTDIPKELAAKLAEMQEAELASQTALSALTFQAGHGSRVVEFRAHSHGVLIDGQKASFEEVQDLVDWLDSLGWRAKGN